MHDRPTLFMLHALGSSGRAWEGVADALGAGFETVALHLPGFGDAADAPDLTVGGMADHAAAAIRAHGATRWMLVGHSMGAKVASVVAARTLAGEAGLFGLAGVVLLAGSPPSPEPMDEDRRRKMIGWAADGPLDAAAAREFVDGNVGAPLAPDADRRAVEDLRRCARHAWLDWLERGSLEDWSDEVGTLDLPALIVVGGADGDLGEAGQRATNALVYPRARLVVEEGAGHLLPLERPQAVAGAVARFWREAAGTGPAVPAPFARLIASPRVSRRMRATLAARALADRPDYQPAALTAAQLRTLRAVAACALPQDGPAIDLAARVDAQLAAGRGDGWRFEGMPPDREAYAEALDALAGFEALPAEAQRLRLEGMAAGASGGADRAAERLQRWFEDLRADLVRVWVAHPATMARIGFDGFANGGDDPRKQGFERLAAGERESWEPALEVAA